ncbi:MAG: hypothetical protein P4L84_17065 [Isosphaeraceae bacterium]|nr:hypothetical protein [Isosphaeraceae bacterium]
MSAVANQPDTFGTLAGITSGGLPQMIGDLGQLPMLTAAQASLPPPFPPPKPPGVPRPSVSTMVVPSIRTIKVSENQSPLPHDRVYYTFNYFDNVNGSVNERLHAPIQGIQVFREIFGFEKTFNDGQGSIGLRVPLNTVSAASHAPAAYGTFGGSSTAVGDLSLIGKYILLRDAESGSLLSGGVAITAPTGPGRFAGFSTFGGGPHTTSFQPFLGYLINSGNWYLHGFTALDVPCTSQDVTMIYNDIGLGYYLRRDAPDSGLNRLVTLIAPTFEVHVNDPLNHRNAFNALDPAATPDMVNLTYGMNIGFNQNTFLTMAVVTPVTGPRPFELEAMAFLNVFFGRSARQAPIVPPVIGGS